MEYEYKKQISYDTLLGVQDNHPITCPLINTLKFTGDCSSKIYVVGLNYYPKHLKVNTADLLDTMNALDKWTNGLLDIYETLSEENKNIIGQKIDITLLRSILEQYFNDDIKEYQSDINGVIDEWIEYINNFTEANDELIKNKELLEDQEKELLFLKINEKSQDECLSLIEFYQSEINEQVDKKNDITIDFKRYVEEEFNTKTNEFSNFLETVRNRNDDLRSYVEELKYQIIKYEKENLKLYQPDHYLDLKFGKEKGVVNIGVLFNDTQSYEKDEDHHFTSLMLGLTKNKIITFDQMKNITENTFTRLYRKKELFEILEKNGYRKIRYYETQHDYLKDKDVFTEQNLNKNTIKYKI